MKNVQSPSWQARNAAPVRVLIVAPSLRILGGQAVQAHRLVERLQASPRLKVTLQEVNPVLPGPLAVLQRLKYVRTAATSIAYIGALLRLVSRHDVVHAFSASYWSFLISPLPALIIARVFGRKVVLNYRSGEAEDHLKHWPISRWLIRRLPHKIVVPSTFLVGVFQRFGIEAEPINNFVPVERLRFRRRQPIRPVLLSNRNLEPMYNVGAVLRAFSRIQQVEPSASLLVAGDGSQREALESLASELSLRNVKFVGRVPNDEISSVYDSCDIFVNASQIDNMPNSIIEAFASGLPVVTSDAGGIPVLVSNEVTGLIVPGGEPAGMARAVIRLLRDEELARRLAESARLEAENLYAWERIQPQWERLYADLAGAGSR